MARKTKQEKAIEAAVSAAFKKHGNGVQFNVFDLCKVTDAGTEAGKAGQNIEDAVKTAVAKYRLD